VVVIVTILDVVDSTTMKKIHISLINSLHSSTPCEDMISVLISHSFCEPVAPWIREDKLKCAWNFHNLVEFDSTKLSSTKFN